MYWSKEKDALQRKKKREGCAVTKRTWGGGSIVGKRADVL